MIQHTIKFATDSAISVTKLKFTAKTITERTLMTVPIIDFRSYFSFVFSVPLFLGHFFRIAHSVVLECFFTFMFRDVQAYVLVWTWVGVLRRWSLRLASLLHRDSESLEIETLVLGHALVRSLVRSLFRSHRSLACFARVLRCACSFICSLFFTPMLVGQMNFNVLFSWCSQSLCVGWFIAILL